MKRWPALFAAKGPADRWEAENVCLKCAEVACDRSYTLHCLCAILISEAVREGHSCPQQEGPAASDLLLSAIAHVNGSIAFAHVLKCECMSCTL